MASSADKARKARNRSEETRKYGGQETYDTERLVRKNSRGGKDITLGDKIGGLYLTKAEQRAAKLMQTRRINDTGRTAARATFITGPNSPVSKARKEAAAVKANTGVSKKATEKMKQMPKTKVSGTASSKPQVSGSMSKSQPKTTTKSKQQVKSMVKKAGKK